MVQQSVKSKLLLISLVTLIVGSIGCGGKQEASGVQVVRPISTIVLGAGEGGRFYFPGTVQAADRADMAFRVGGQLIELPVNEGDQVQKGQLLARLDPRDYELNMHEARAAYEKAEADARRYQRLYERDAIPLADLELRRAERDVSFARFEQAKLNVGYTKLLAPYAGRVGRKFVENFEDVQAKDPIMSLQNVDRLEIVIDVPEYLMATARKGRSVSFIASFTASGDKEYPLRVKEVSAEADIRTQTYQVTYSMAQPQEILVLPGMTAQVVMIDDSFQDEVETSEFVVPAYAVVGDPDGNPFVWIFDPETSTVSRRQVTVGRVAGQNQIWITSGVESGERVAVTGVHHMEEGMKVRLEEG